MCLTEKNPSPPPPGFSHFLLPAAKSQEEELPWAPQGVSMDAQKTQEAGVGVKSRSISFSPFKIGFIFNYVYLCGYAHVRCPQMLEEGGRPLELNAGNPAQAPKSSPYS